MSAELADFDADILMENQQPLQSFGFENTWPCGIVLFRASGQDQHSRIPLCRKSVHRVGTFARTRPVSSSLSLSVENAPQYGFDAKAGIPKGSGTIGLSEPVNLYMPTTDLTATAPESWPRVYFREFSLTPIVSPGQTRPMLFIRFFRAQAQE
ncbi:MAG: hypothetical protein V1659_02515 [Candidatus Woesearchaeota archaeon]